jgi:tetratricopeptide (TPR) repeat protein
MTFGVLPSYRADPENALLARVLQSAQRALALDARLPDAHLATALAYDRSLRFRESEPKYRAAVALDPMSPVARHWLGEALLAIGKLDEAIAELTRATELDPLSPVMNNSQGAALIMARRFAESLPWNRRSLELDPNLTWASWNLAEAYVFLGKADSAIAVIAPVYRRDPSAPAVAALLVFAYAAAGRWEDAQQLRTALNRPGGDASGGVQAAYAELVFGNRKPLLQMFETLDGQRRVFDTLGWFSCHPMLDPLASEQRFVAALRTLDVELCPLRSPWPVKSAPATR